MQNNNNNHSNIKHLISKESVASPNKQYAIYIVTYVSQNLKVKGYLIEPKEAGDYDGLLYLRGGFKSVGMVRIERILQYAAEGFVVFAPFYRGNEGGEGVEDFGGEDRHDAYSAFELLSSHPNIKDKRVHVVGFSRGGIMAGLVAEAYNPVSMVSWGGVSNCHLMYEERRDLRKMLRRTFSGDPIHAKKTYDLRSPIHLTNEINCPVLIIHGENDEHVSVQHAYQLHEALQLHKKQSTLWILSGLGHLMTIEEKLYHTKKVCRWLKQQNP